MKKSRIFSINIELQREWKFKIMSLLEIIHSIHYILVIKVEKHAMYFKFYPNNKGG